MRRRVAVRAALALLLTAGLLGAALARGERVQQEHLIVSLSGGISPRKLPRDRAAPVAVNLAGGIETDDGSPLPRVNWIRLELAWRGELDTKGLAVCPRARLRNTDSSGALQLCGPAVVGHGKLFAKIFVPNQPSFGVHARLVAFNGRTEAGRPAVWVHAYSSDPPVSFVLPFAVRHDRATSRTILVTTIRKSVGPWPHVANFSIQISRKFRYRGRTRSYLNASCPAPPRFTAGFSYARATYTFADGRQLRPQVVRSCRTR